MNKVFNYLSVIVAAAGISFAADAKEAIVKGRTIDANTNEGEPAAVLQFYKSSDLSKPVAYTLTDVDGSFSQTLDEQAEYVVVFTSVGRKEVHKTFLVGDEAEIDLGALLLEDDVEMLEAGKVVAMKSLVKMDVDRISYKVVDDVDAQTSTVLDMLRKVPMVSVDASDNITVNGSSSFKVLLDGKPNVMMSSNPSSVFKSMPASAVLDIEVVTNPGVKYDAEGVGGVLNIVTSRSMDGSASAVNTDGYNATLGLQASTRGMGGRAFVTAQKGKLSLSANVFAMDTKTPGASSEIIREQLDEAGNVLSSMFNSSSSLMKTPIKTASLNASYDIDPLRLVSVNFGYSSISSKSFSESLTQMTAGAFSSSYGSNTESIWDMGSLSGGIDYQKTSAKDRNRILTLSYQFSSNPAVTDSKSLFSGDSGMIDLTDRYTDGSTNTLENTLQIDYTLPLASGMKLETGAKYINRSNRSDQQQFLSDGSDWIYSETGSMVYRHDSNIAAAYAEYSLSRTSWSAKAGLRYEQTFQDVSYKLGNGSDFSLSYGNLVPALSFQYNISPMQNLGLSYNMRISRPGITYLNPYVDTSDPTVKSYGNTGLEAEQAHNISLVYNYFTPKVTLSATLRYSFSDNAISAWNFYDADGILNSTFGNICSNSTTGLNAFMNVNATKSTRIILNGAVNYSSLSSEVLGLSNGGWSGNAMLALQQTLPWEVRLSTNVIYSTGRQTLDGYSSGMSMITAGLTKSFLDNRLSVSVNAVAPLAKGFKMINESHTEGSDYRTDSIMTIPMAQGTLNITWNFGKNNRNVSVKKTRKSISNDDVMNLDNGAESLNSYSGM